MGAGTSDVKLRASTGFRKLVSIAAKFDRTWQPKIRLATHSPTPSESRACLGRLGQTAQRCVRLVPRPRGVDLTRKRLHSKRQRVTYCLYQ